MLACLAGPVINILHIPHVPNHLCFHLFTFAVCRSVGWSTVFGFPVLSLTELVSFVRQVQGPRGAVGLRAPMPVDMQPHQGLYHYEASPSQPSGG